MNSNETPYQTYPPVGFQACDPNYPPPQPFPTYSQPFHPLYPQPSSQYSQVPYYGPEYPTYPADPTYPAFPTYPPPPMPYHHGMVYPPVHPAPMDRSRSMDHQSQVMRGSSSIRATSNPLPSGRAASTWTEMTGTRGGVFKPVGVRNERGVEVPHKEGQCIRVAQTMNGVTTRAGLVDYCNLRIQNLDPEVTEGHMRWLWGHLDGVKNMVKCKDRRGHKGYGFINFNTPEQAKAAFELIDKAQVMGREVKVNYHQPSRLKPEKVLPGFVPGLG